MSGEHEEHLNFIGVNCLSVVGAVGDAHRQLKETLASSPYAVFKDDCTLILRIRKGKGEMDVEIAVEPPPKPEVETVFPDFDPEKHVVDDGGICFYDTIRHQPYIREWLPKDDPGRSYIITQYLYKGEVIHTVGHAFDDVTDPVGLWAEEQPRIIWLGAISRQSRTEAEESFYAEDRHEGATVIPDGSGSTPS